MELDDLRDEIRKRDEEIIKLISERTELAKKVGEYKLDNGLPIRNKDVECTIVSRYKEEGAKLGLSEEVMKNVSKALIKEAVDKNRLKALDPQTAKRYMRYVPIWAAV